MTVEEIKKTYPANTVYLSYDKSGNINGAIPFDWYAEKTKTYSDCCEAMKRKRNDGQSFRELQNAELYGLSKLYQRTLKQASQLESAKFVIENVIEELQETCDELEEDE